VALRFGEQEDAGFCYTWRCYAASFACPPFLFGGAGDWRTFLTEIVDEFLVAARAAMDHAEYRCGVWRAKNLRATRRTFSWHPA
jgi:hypothetical protein